MRVLVAGGRGFLGRHLIASGAHEWVVTSRSPGTVEGAEILVWDPNEGPAPDLNGFDAVVNLVGESVGEGRWTRKKMKRIRESRVNATRHLVEAIGRADPKPKVLVNSSAVGYYGCHGDTEITEETEPAEDFFSEMCREWEAEANQAEGVRVVILRTGIVLGRDGGALPRILTPFKWFVGGPISSGRFWWPWIHADDMTALILKALDSDWSGPYNASAPNPVTNRDFSKALGSALGRPSFMPAPKFMLRIMIGKFANFLTCSQRLIPKRTMEAGFSYLYPEIGPALQDLLCVPAPDAVQKD